MKRLSLHTTKHKASCRALINSGTLHFLKQAEWVHSGHAIVEWDTGNDNDFAKTLLHLFYDIAIHQHPVYRHAPKLRDMAQQLRDTPLYINDLMGLKAFLHTNHVLHIDGYITFRMDAYHEKLDMMLYTVAKKWLQK